MATTFCDYCSTIISHETITTRVDGMDYTFCSEACEGEYDYNG